MPHWPQNLALGGFSAPQAAQVGACGAPHLIQNLFPALVSAPQLGHFMGFLAMARPNLPDLRTAGALHVVIDRQHLPRDDYPPTDVQKGSSLPERPHAQQCESNSLNRGEQM